MTFQKGDIITGRNIGGLYLVTNNNKKDSHRNDCYELYVLSTPHNFETFETIGTKILKFGEYVEQCFDKVG